MTINNNLNGNLYIYIYIYNRLYIINIINIYIIRLTCIYYKYNTNKHRLIQ